LSKLERYTAGRRQFRFKEMTAGKANLVCFYKFVRIATSSLALYLKFPLVITEPESSLPYI